MNDLSSELRDLTLPVRCPAPSRHKDTTAGGSRKDGVIRRRWKVLRDVFRPRVQARGVPFEYVVEVTTRCNLSCPMCARSIKGHLGDRDNRDMDMQTFQRFLERVRDIASFIWFTGFGEPMMHKRFMEMVMECHRAGIATGASTNGTILNDKSQERILDSGLDVLIVSFDGADKETYERIRIGANFDKVRDNVRRLAARKVSRGAKKPWLVLQMIELKDNRGQIGSFRQMWNIPGVDAIRIKDNQWEFEESIAFEGQRKRRGKRPCPFLWRGAPLILCDGTMLPCCFGRADKSFSTVNNATIEKLWNSSPVQKLRRSHLEGRGVSELYCKHCSFFEPGKITMAASVLLPILTQKKSAHRVEAINRRIHFLG